MIAETQTNTTRCSACCEDRPASDFYLKRGRPRNICKGCFKTKSTVNRRLRVQAMPGWQPRVRRTKADVVLYINDWVSRNREKSRAYSKKYKDQNKESVRAQSKASKRRAKLKGWGISEEELKIIFERQNGICAICEDKKVNLHGSVETHLDHCHKTNRFRGFLCYRCNMALGKFGDDPERLIRAAKYITGS